MTGHPAIGGNADAALDPRAMSSRPVAPAEGEETFDEGRPFADLRDSGLLWLINRVVFHPRGYALGLVYAPDTQHPLVSGGVATGWQLQGDGSEPWSMGELPAELLEQGFRTEDDLFRLVKELLR